MFNHPDHPHHHGARGRHPGHGPDAGRELREDLRRSFRRHGPGGAFAIGELFGGRRRGAGIRRGDIRPLILAALTDRPMHGYELIQELEARSGGRWRPSAGSVYPTLQQLADEGLVNGEDVDGRRVYTLTDIGRKQAAENPAPSPWDDASEDEGDDVRNVLAQLMAAVLQVHKIGSPQARREARRILIDTRKQVYRLLSEDEVDDASTEEADSVS